MLPNEDAEYGVNIDETNIGVSFEKELVNRGIPAPLEETIDSTTGFSVDYNKIHTSGDDIVYEDRIHLFDSKTEIVYIPWGARLVNFETPEYHGAFPK